MTPPCMATSRQYLRCDIIDFVLHNPLKTDLSFPWYFRDSSVRDGRISHDAAIKGEAAGIVYLLHSRKSCNNTAARNLAKYHN